MAAIEMTFTVKNNAKDILDKIYAMAEYIEKADDSDTFAALAAEYGELSVNDCLSTSVAIIDGVAMVSVETKGPLHNLLQEFDRMTA